MKELLEATGRFDQIETIIDNGTAEIIKRQAADYVETFEPSSVDEVFFYFTGHGTITENETHLLLPDFQDSQLQQTSIAGSRVDEWLRRVNPRLAVKFIDCCHAGTDSIKRIEQEYEILKRSKGVFKDLYFFYSSHRNQSSFIKDGFSVFTEAFIRFVSTRPDGPLRYITLEEGLSDHFSDNPDQNPRFVHQGGHSQIFCTVDSNLRSVASKLVAGDEAQPHDQLEVALTESSSPTSESQIPVIERLQLVDEASITHDLSKEVTAKVESLFENSSGQDLLEGVFKTEVQLGDNFSVDVPYEEQIGEWLKHRGRHRYFAKHVMQEPPPLSPASLDLFNPFARKPYVSGFITSAGLENDCFILTFRSQFNSVRSTELGVVLIWSPIRLALFSYITTLKWVSWDTTDYENEVQWEVQTYQRDHLEQAIPDIEGLILRTKRLALSGIDHLDRQM